MSIIEKAEAYAEGKALSAVTSAIEAAYAAGYRDGYDEGLKSRENIPANVVEDGVEYIDLGLPNGTKWATDYLKDENGKIKLYTYDEARNLNIPTPLQFREFTEYTRGSYHTDSNFHREVKIIGANGKRFSWDCFDSNNEYKFWLKDMTEKGSERNAAIKTKIENVFKGEKLPVILVR